MYNNMILIINKIIYLMYYDQKKQSEMCRIILFNFDKYLHRSI